MNISLKTLSLALSASFLLQSTSLAHSSHDGDSHSAGAMSSASEQRTRRDIAFLQQKIDQEPEDRGLLAKRASLELKIARRHAEHEDYQVAEGTFRKVLSLRIGADANVGLAYALVGQHRFTEALTYARRASLSHPEAPTVRALLGDLHFALGHYAEAQMAYESMSADSLSLQSLARMAQIEQQRGSMDKAEDLYRDALVAGELLKESPGRLAWCLTMIGDLAMERGRLEVAESAYARALAMDPASHAILFRQARAEESHGELLAARTILQGLVKSHPRPMYWIALGGVLEELGDDHGAEHVYELAEADMQLDLKKGDYGHLRELAEYYLAREMHAQEAVRLAQLDIDEVRQDSGAFDTLGWAQLAAGDAEGALRSIRSALDGGASSPRLLSRAAIIFDANGMRAEAIRLAQVAVIWNPSLLGQFSEELAGEFLPAGSRLRDMAVRGI